MEQREFPIDPNKARVYLHYSRYWHFCKYSGKYKSGHVKNQKKYFFEVLAEIYNIDPVEVLLPRVDYEKNGRIKSYA